MIRLACALLGLTLLAACGLKGPLERPPPAWGEARQRYEEEQRAAQERARQEEERARQATQQQRNRVSGTLPAPASPNPTPPNQ